MESISVRDLGKKKVKLLLIEAMMNTIDTKLRLETKAGQVYWARSKPIEIIKDCYKEQYLQFFGFCVSYEAHIRGFKYGCRPVVGLDGWFLIGPAGGTR